MTKAMVLSELKTPLKSVELATRDLEQGEVRVELQAASLNRRDYWITQGLYPRVKLPSVLGSDGAGVVREVAADVSDDWLDQLVLIYPGNDWGASELAQDKQFEPLGMPSQGTLAESIVVSADKLVAQPKHLSAAAAATMPLAGVTAYRALMVQGLLQPKQSVLVTGVGGGVACWALQLAVAHGARVAVTSGTAAKRQRAIELGASAAFDYRDPELSKSIKAEFGAVDLIVDGSGGMAYNQWIDLAKPGGRIVNYGATLGKPPELDLFKMFWKQLNLVGTSMGSPGDFHKFVEFVGAAEIEPVVDRIIPLERVNEGLESMARSEQFGKIVIDTASS